MRILFASTQGAGHFGPLIPFIDAALRQGHQVLIVGPPGLKARDYPFRAGAAPPDELLGPLWGRMPSLPPGQGDVVVVGVIFARLNVEAMLPAMSAAIEEGARTSSFARRPSSPRRRPRSSMDCRMSASPSAWPGWRRSRWRSRRLPSRIDAPVSSRGSTSRRT